MSAWYPDPSVVNPPILKDNPIYPIVIEALKSKGTFKCSIYTSLAIVSKMTKETAPLFIDAIDPVQIAVRDYYLGWDK
jgi:hypothetical protein